MTLKEKIREIVIEVYIRTYHPSRVKRMNRGESIVDQATNDILQAVKECVPDGNSDAVMEQARKECFEDSPELNQMEGWNQCRQTILDKLEEE